ncbi:MAG: hypothetical protein IPN34_22125 [Planctomycetes bacterium]|nr:hypothetical protein [Planctomycetota bacterium]
MTYVKPERIRLKSHPEYDERWLEDRIADDPSILELGDLLLKDRQRNQPRAGRLDLLLQDPDATRRYEVEVQLGATDEAHIIRTLEYWDLERKRYPQYEHTAVLVAEDITSRFLNVIGLFNGFIPLIAIQLSALRIGDSITLSIAKVLDETRLGLVEDDEEVQPVADRAYWEERAGKPMLAVIDELFALLRKLDSSLEPNYTKPYVGIAQDGRRSTDIIFRPHKSVIHVAVRLEKTEETTAELETSGLDVGDYDLKPGRYRFRLAKGDLEKHRELLSRTFRKALEI